MTTWSYLSLFRNWRIQMKKKNPLQLKRNHVTARSISLFYDVIIVRSHDNRSELICETYKKIFLSSKNSIRLFCIKPEFVSKMSIYKKLFDFFVSGKDEEFYRSYFHRIFSSLSGHILTSCIWKRISFLSSYLPNCWWFFFLFSNLHHFNK